MKRIKIYLFLTACCLMFSAAKSQSLNGQKFEFPNGTKDWSNVLYKELQSEKMSKKGVEPVKLAFRIKLNKKVAAGKWYYVEVKNMSDKTTIEFTISATNPSPASQDRFSYSLAPGATQVAEKFNWFSGGFKKTKPDEEPEDFDFYFEKISAK